MRNLYRVTFTEYAETDNVYLFVADSIQDVYDHFGARYNYTYEKERYIVEHVGYTDLYDCGIIDMYNAYKDYD